MGAMSGEGETGDAAEAAGTAGAGGGEGTSPTVKRNAGANNEGMPSALAPSSPLTFAIRKRA